MDEKLETEIDDNEIDNNLPDDTDASGVEDNETEDISLQDVLDKELEELRENDPEDSDEADTEAAATDSEAGDEKAGQEAEAKDPDKSTNEQGDPDEVDPDAELMEGMKERTRERFTEMRTQLKASEEQLNEFQSSRQELHNVILESTATSQQLSGALQIFKDINSGNIDGAVKALPELKMLYNAVAQVAGQPEMGGDPLQNHPDLKKAVEDLDMTQENAEEMARLRLQQSQQQQRVQLSQRTEQRNVQTQRFAQTAATSIKQWEDGLLSSDPDYKLLQPKLVEASKQIMQNTSPDQWLPLLQHEYENMHLGLALANKQQQRNSPAPVRPAAGSAAGAYKKDTKNMSMEDLMASELANMRG